jgi:cell division protein FtsI/penicillin-binding protein 2
MGIEKFFDNDLEGQDGKIIFQNDGWGIRGGWTERQ